MTVATALQTIGTFATAAIAWLVLEFIGRPLRKFFDLRGEIIRRLVQFANVRARYRAVPDDSGATSGEFEDLGLSTDEIKQLDVAQEVYRDLAAQMSAFAENETLALKVAWLLGCNPLGASAGLIGLSNSLQEYGPERRFHKKALSEGLKLKNMPGLPAG